MLRLVASLVLVTLLGCGKSQPPPAAVPAPVDVKWPDAAPLPQPEKPADKPADKPVEKPESPETDQAPGADASRSTGSSG